MGATIGQRRDEEEWTEPFTPDEKRKYEKRQAKRAKAEARNEDLREQARQAIDRSGLPEPISTTHGKKTTVERRPLPSRPPHPLDVPKEMRRISGKEKGDKAWKLYKRAGREFENGEFVDARRTMKPLAEAYPDIADVQELWGLSLYRRAEWEDAIEALETFRRLSGTAEQNPVLMDCHRALGQWADVEELWAELGEHSPSGDLINEGRIVMAGAQADQGFIDSGVRTLEKGWKIPNQPQERHLRRAYVLADLLERDGKIPKSRKLFGWIAAKAPDYGDAAERAAP